MVATAYEDGDSVERILFIEPIFAQLFSLPAWNDS